MYERNNISNNKTEHVRKYYIIMNAAEIFCS